MYIKAVTCCVYLARPGGGLVGRLLFSLASSVAVKCWLKISKSNEKIVLLTYNKTVSTFHETKVKTTTSENLVFTKMLLCPFVCLDVIFVCLHFRFLLCSFDIVFWAANLILLAKHNFGVHC